MKARIRADSVLSHSRSVILNCSKNLDIPNGILLKKVYNIFEKVEIPSHAKFTFSMSFILVKVSPTKEMTICQTKWFRKINKFGLIKKVMPQVDNQKKDILLAKSSKTLAQH